MIESEIMTRQLDISWEDIAGLEFAKKAVTEAII